MTPKLTEEMREALTRQPGGAIEVEDDRNRKVYVLVEQEAFGRLVDDILRQALKIGLDQRDRGDSDPWDADAFLAEAHRRRCGWSVPWRWRSARSGRRTAST